MVILNVDFDIFTFLFLELRGAVTVFRGGCVVLSVYRETKSVSGVSLSSWFSCICIFLALIFFAPRLVFSLLFRFLFAYSFLLVLTF